MIIGDNFFIQNKILSSAAILEAVPQLRTMREQIRTLQAACSGCQGKPDKQHELELKFNQLREYLVKLPDDKRQFIRTKLGTADRIRISYRTGSGNSTKILSGDL